MSINKNQMESQSKISIGDCYVRPAMGGRPRSIWKIVALDGNECRADLYDFGEQGIYHYVNEPFGIKRFAAFIQVASEDFERVERLYSDAHNRALDVLASAWKVQTSRVEFGTCLYTQTFGYQGVLKLIAQSGNNDMLCEYVHVSKESLSRETIRPGICSLSQYEDDESKMTIDSDVYDKLLKIMAMTCAAMQAHVNRCVQEYKSRINQPKSE